MVAGYEGRRWPKRRSPPTNFGLSRKLSTRIQGAAQPEECRPDKVHCGRASEPQFGEEATPDSELPFPPFVLCCHWLRTPEPAPSAMLWARSSYRLARSSSAFAACTLPRLARTYSAAAPTYENIIVSNPRPGVGLSVFGPDPRYAIVGAASAPLSVLPLLTSSQSL